MDKTTIELAINALEAEKAKLDGAIAELRASLNGQGTGRKATGADMTVAPVKTASRSGKRGMSAAGRRAISLAAKRRWAKAKAAGKSSL